MLYISIKILKTAQAWYMDFAIALLLFIFTLVVYFSYTTNFQKQEKGELDVMLTDAKSISSSLTLSGYPKDWSNETVIRIGIADEQKLNETKMRYFSELNYTLSKRRFGTVYDYFVFLEGANNSLINFGTKCGVGSPLINVTKRLKRAGYFKQAENEMEDEIDALEAKLGVDIYKEWTSAADMLNNISNYDFVLMETPQLSAAQVPQLDDYVNNGGFIFVSERIISGENGSVLGITYFKRTKCKQNATIVLDDLFLALKKGQSFEPDECPYIDGDATKIAEFPDGKISIAKWDYGKGAVYFFSDFDVDFLASFQQNIADAMESFMTGCGTIDDIQVNKTNAKRLIKVDRYLNYNSKVVKMVVYLWQ